VKSYSSLATLVESEYVYTLTNRNTETYHVLAVLDVLARMTIVVSDWLIGKKIAPQLAWG
jgi:hypothetical protein